jgi:hypothetical protein
MESASLAAELAIATASILELTLFWIPGHE